MKKRAIKKRMVSAMLVLLLLFNVIGGEYTIVQTYAAGMEKGSDIVLGETKLSCKLRENPSKYADVTVILPEDTLVYITGFVTNEKENVWYTVSYYGETKYLFSENVNEHKHVYDIPVSDSENDNECRVCECGSIECNANDVTQTVIPAIVGGALTAETAVGAVLGLSALYYGLREIAGQLIPVMVNQAGALVSVTVEELERALEKYGNQEGANDDERKLYFPAKLIKSDKDTVQLVDFSKALSMDEACDYVDSVLNVEGAFGRFGQFVTKVSFCNIYTLDVGNAESLCNKIISCSKNGINSFGNSNNLDCFELNAGKNVNATYKHFHLHNSFDQKATVHVLFGKPLYLVKNAPKI